MLWKYRWSSTLGDLESTAEKVWGIEKYNPETDKDNPVVFFGLYGLPDFYSLWRHSGEKHILWAGSDILHFDKGYFLDDGEIKMTSSPLADWLNKYCTSWVENEVEQKLLKEWDIASRVVPSFLGEVKDYNICFKPGNKVYASVSGDNFEKYGWNKIEKLAVLNPDIEFHLYGNTKEWLTINKNVIVHGRITKEQMNTEIKEMQGGLRLLEFDGFSEVLAKSILWGQWPISEIDYPFMLKPNQISEILNKTEPNLAGREYFLSVINKYPWSNI